MEEITLRKINVSDLEMIRNWRNSEEVSRYMYTDQHITEEDQKKWFDKINKDNSSKHWVVESHQDPVGLASITNINLIFSSCFFGIYIGSQSERTKGLGRKILFKIMFHVFEEMNLNKLKCEAFDFNEKAIGLYKAMGFKQEAFYKEHCFKNGKYEDVIGLAMLRSEWSEKKVN